MNPIDFFKYGAAYARYQQGMIDPGDPSAGRPMVQDATGKLVLPPFTSDEQRNMAIDRDTLQIAKTIGDDLTIEEFKQLRDQVESVHDRYKDHEDLAMTNRNKQEAVWELPEQFQQQRENPTHFKPMRFADGTPVDWNDQDPQGTQNKLRSVPYEMVKHDAQLRDAWLAAQNGQLATLMENGAAWQASTDPATLSQALGSLTPDQRDSLTAPLKALLNAQDSGQLEQQLNQQMSTASRQLATGELASFSDKKLGDWLGGKPMFLQQPAPEKFGGELDAIFDKPAAERKPEEITKWIESFRAQHDKETRAQVQRNQLNAVASQPVAGLQENVKQEGAPTQQAELLPVADGHTRFWHGGVEYTGGKRFLSPDREFAEGYTGGGRSLHYVDIENSSPHLKKAFDDSGTNTKAPFISFEAPEEIAKNLKPVTQRPQAPDTLNPRESAKNLAGRSVDNARTEAAGATLDPVEAVASLANKSEVVPQGAPAGVGQAANAAAASMGWMDKIQMGMDAAGVADPTPIVDGVNAGISLVRAFTDPKRAGEHLMNAGISVVSMVPYIGDLAKLAKYGGKGAKAVAGAAKAGDAAAMTGKVGHRSGLADAIGGLLGGMGGGGGAEGGAASGGGNGGGGSGGGIFGSLFGDGSEDGNQAGKMLDGFTDKFMDLAKVFGPAAIAVTAAVGGLKLLVDWLKNVDQTSRKMIEDNRELAKYNGNLAASYAKLDRDRLRRDIEASNDMAGPMRRLTAAQSRYEGAQEDLTRPFKRLSTDIQALKTEFATATLVAINLLTPIGKAIDAFYELQKNSDEVRTAAQALARNSENRAKQRRL